MVPIEWDSNHSSLTRQLEASVLGDEKCRPDVIDWSRLFLFSRRVRTTSLLSGEHFRPALRGLLGVFHCRQTHFLIPTQQTLNFGVVETMPNVCWKSTPSTTMTWRRPKQSKNSPKTFDDLYQRLDLEHLIRPRAFGESETPQTGHEEWV